MSFDTIHKLIAVGKLHFVVILMCLTMQVIEFSDLYRFFAYLNLVFVLILFPSMLEKDNRSDQKRLLYVLAIPIVFILLHFLAVMHLEYIKEIRRITLATFLAIGIWMLAKNSEEYVSKNIFKVTLAILFFYVAVQSIALWFFNKPYGTLKNPHYLAFFSAAFLIFAIYAFFKATRYIKWFIVISILLLGAFILHSASRPTWIGLIFSAILVLFFLEPKLRKYTAVTFVLVLIGLVAFNIGNFSGRFEALLFHLNTEERAVIWQDAWTLQKSSSISQWIIGHGLSLSAFEEAFKPYSQFHLVNNDFNTPHNYFLEILYASGVIGLLLFLYLIYIIVSRLLQLIKVHKASKDIYLLLLFMLTTNLITVSITVPFTSSYNLMMIAMIVGIMLYLRESASRQKLSSVQNQNK